MERAGAVDAPHTAIAELLSRFEQLHPKSIDLALHRA
jgi:hypothetical protein